MTLTIGFLFALLAGMVYLFLTERLPVDLTAFVGLVVLIFCGYVTPQEAFTGFASSAVITMLSIFIVGASLLHTGVADIIAGRIHSWVGNRETHLVVTIMCVAALLSSFMNNIAATAVLMPAVASLARRAGISPARLFMPLSYAAILGGTTTLVGTPPNILAASMLEESGLVPFGLFDFTPIGVALLLVGMLYMITVGRALLPTHEIGPALKEEQDLAQVYQLHQRMFSIRIPEHSGLNNLSLAEARLATTLGVQVLAITRSRERQLAPGPETVLQAGDVLLVEGNLPKLRELLHVQSLKVRKAVPSDLPRPIKGVSGIRTEVMEGSPLVNRTLRELRFREQFGIVVIGIRRGEEIVRENLADERLLEGDEIFGLGERSRLGTLAAHPNLGKSRIGLSALQGLRSHLYLLRIPGESGMAGTSIADSRFSELVGLTVAGIIRKGTLKLAVDPQETIQPDDRLLVAGEPSRVLGMLELGEVSLESTVPEPVIESEDVRIVEATVAPRSSLAGKTLRELSFRERFGMQVLAVWREGELVRGHITDEVLRFGDALLLQGPDKRVAKLSADRDLVVLSEVGRAKVRRKKAVFALLGLLLMIGIVVSGFQPIQVAAFAAATLVILSGAITMEEAYRAVEWRAIFLVAAVLPVGFAMERTGAAMLLAQTVTELAGPIGPYIVLAAMVVLSSLLSQGLDGAPAVVLLAPVVIQTAEQLGMSPYPLMMGVGVAASAAFMTPFSHKANLLVMAAGGYRSMDYVKVGTPLTIILVILMVLLVPIFFPF